MWYVRPVTNAQTESLCWSLEYSMIVKLLTEHHLEFLNLKGGCRGSSESIHLSKCQIVGNLMPQLNVSGYRCVSDCRSRGRKFDSSPVPYFRGD